MSEDNIPERLSGQVIKKKFFNLIRSVLGDDLVPRSTLGIVTDLGGNLGNDSYRWLSAFAQKYKLGAVASGLSIEEDSGAIIFKVGGTERLRITSSGVITAANDFTAKTIGRAALKDAVNYQLSSTISFNTNSTTPVDVTNSSVTINRTGKPLHICLVPDGTTSDSGIELWDNSGGSPRADIYLNEASTDIDTADLWAIESSTGATFKRNIYPPSILQFFIWSTTTGDVTYKLRTEVISSNHAIYFSNCKLLVREL